MIVASFWSNEWLKSKSYSMIKRCFDNCTVQLGKALGPVVWDGFI